MDNITSIALSRLVAQQRATDVTAINLANAGTTGFHAERMVFSDWLVRAQGAKVPGDSTITFTQDRATYRDTQTGPLQHTANPLDIAIGGDGYFSVQTPAGVRLTRAGHFSTSATGEIVDGSGNALLTTSGGKLQLSRTDHDITIAADGTVTSNNGTIGRIGVVKPDNAQGLRAEGGQLSLSGSPSTPVATPQLIQGAIEGSNVQPTVELTRMMSDLREFQFTSELVQAEADRMRSAIDKLTQMRS